MSPHAWTPPDLRAPARRRPRRAALACAWGAALVLGTAVLIALTR